MADYPGLNENLQMIMQVYRNSIGDIAVPEYAVWNNIGVPGVDSFIMIRLIWLVWLIHQYFCMIMLLNFLISIVSEIFSEVQSQSNYYKYSLKSSMNTEALLIYKSMGYLNENFNTMII